MTLEEYQKRQSQTAKDFRTQMPSVAQEQENRLKEQSRRSLASDLAGTRGAFSQRGLLYSGLRRGAEADITSNNAAQAAAQRANINQTLEGQAQALEQNAIGSGLRLQEQRQQMADADYQAKLQALQQRQSAISGLGGAFGGLAGMAIGGRK